MAAMNPSVLRSRVTHSRSVPVRNSFTYGVDYVLLGEQQLAGAEKPHLFSFGRSNFVSLHPGDHGVSGEGGAAWVRRIATEAGVGEVAEVTLLTHPRYWGYVFNPVSFWFMSGPDGALLAVLSEVHNTFGDRHCYICRGADGGRKSASMSRRSSRLKGATVSASCSRTSALGCGSAMTTEKTAASSPR
jgi:DUF1365 family protein